VTFKNNLRKKLVIVELKQNYTEEKYWKYKVFT